MICAIYANVEIRVQVSAIEFASSDPCERADFNFNSPWPESESYFLNTETKLTLGCEHTRVMHLLPGNFLKTQVNLNSWHMHTGQGDALHFGLQCLKQVRMEILCVALFLQV